GVTFLGQKEKDELPKIFFNSDVFVLPSIWEGLPLSLLEALAAGLPIISTNVGDIPNICRDGVNSIIIPPKDSKSLANAMQRLLLDEKLRNEFGRKSQEIAKDYSLEYMWEKTMDLYVNTAHT
ncbi:glycosyltransferase, partial [Candidatus Altiarchaeota archaeon]